MLNSVQVENVGVTRASNAAHYEFFSMVMKRTTDITLDHPLWKQAAEDFAKAFSEEDTAFRQYTSSLQTEPLKLADEERDKLYSALRDAIKAYVKFPVAETADAAKKLKRVLDNYNLHIADNYLKESGTIVNILQDFGGLAAELDLLRLTDIVAQLREANDKVRKLLSDRNVERSTYILGALKTARKVSDQAYAILILYTNAYAALNPSSREAADLVRLLNEDLKYFRQHAYGNASKKEEPEPSPEPDAPADNE